MPWVPDSSKTFRLPHHPGSRDFWKDRTFKMVSEFFSKENLPRLKKNKALKKKRLIVNVHWHVWTGIGDLPSNIRACCNKKGAERCQVSERVGCGQWGKRENVMPSNRGLASRNLSRRCSSLKVNIIIFQCNSNTIYIYKTWHPTKVSEPFM